MQTPAEERALQMKNLTTEHLSGFKSWSDYEELLRLIETNSSKFDAIPVGSKFSDVGFIERWYRDRESRRIWRLVEPDPPFSGLWAPVPEQELT